MVKSKSGAKPFINCLLLLILLATASHLSSCVKENPANLLNGLNLPREIQQVVLVTTSGWDCLNGTLALFSRTDTGWRLANNAVPVTVGRNGLGWGLGLFPIESKTAPIKIEGDGRAPAGIFELGDAFGYLDSAPPGCKLMYRTTTDRDYFIDDANSPDYNSWMSLTEEVNKPEEHWKSFERMKRNDHLYELGIIVKHNMRPVVSGRGSAIFLHVWSAKGKATSGCTAMSKEDLEIILRWLDPSKRPVLIQIPKSELKNLAQNMKLE